jgi:curli production assembly/transport component CsgG/holdfast attachment protein HfaB
MKILLTSLFLLSLLLTGCAQKQNQIVFTKKEFYQQKELLCLKSYIPKKSIFVGVGAIPDLTGKSEFGTLGSHYVSQAGSQMMVSSLKQGGVKLVNRHDINIVNYEKEAAMHKWLGNGIQYRKIHKGSLLGSNYYVTGSISTLDFNTESKGIELYIDGVGAGFRYQEIIVGGDFIVTNTQTSEIIYARTVHFKLYAREIQGGMYHIYNEHLVNINMGYSGNDPLQMATRYMIDKAAADIIKEIYKIDLNVCKNLENINK